MLDQDLHNIVRRQTENRVLDLDVYNKTADREWCVLDQGVHNSIIRLLTENRVRWIRVSIIVS